MPPSRAREVAVRLALVAGSVAAGALLLEAGLRMAGWTPVEPSRSRLHDREWTTLLDAYPSNPRGYFDLDLREAAARERFLRLAPVRYDAIARRTPYAIECRYNHLRFREREPGPRSPAIFRLAVVGDSFTEGQGVREADTLPRRLEAVLNASGRGQWEVVNCGRRAANFPELTAIFSACLAYDPDVVVYGMVLNDPDRSPEFEARQSYLNDWILTNSEDRGDEPPAPLRLLAFTEGRWEKLRVDRASVRWYRDLFGEANRDGWARTEAAIESMDRQMTARGGRLLIALWPLLVDLGPAYPFADVHASVHRFAAAAGVPCLDLRPALAAHTASSLWVHEVDHHPNETAHRLAAEALAPVVMGLLEHAPPSTIAGLLESSHVQNQAGTQVAR
jgi:hypothetical protein